MRVEGLAALLERAAVLIYVNKHEADGLKRVTSVRRATCGGRRRRHAALGGANALLHPARRAASLLLATG
jgi:hypothetical protein